MENPSAAGQKTGTPDTTYNLTAVLYHALQGVENCKIYAQDAGSDEKLSGFFRQAGEQQRQLAEQAKILLHDVLMRETQGEGGQQGGQGSAFSFDQQQQGSSDAIRQPVSAGSTGMGQQGDQTSGSDRY